MSQHVTKLRYTINTSTTSTVLQQFQAKIIKLELYNCNLVKNLDDICKRCLKVQLVI